MLCHNNAQIKRVKAEKGKKSADNTRGTLGVGTYSLIGAKQSIIEVIPERLGTAGRQ
ncbi:hypothetical protein VCSRO175_0568 [Vibrio cholerae]|nr:hypothetical protein VCSRO175_0568 [Vibrio cholerae]